MPLQKGGVVKKSMVEWHVFEQNLNAKLILFRNWTLQEQKTVPLCWHAYSSSPEKKHKNGLIYMSHTQTLTLAGCRTELLTAKKIELNFARHSN